MFDETRKRINYWNSEVKRLQKAIEEHNANYDDSEEWYDRSIDLHLDFDEAKDNLNFAWQDDELEEMGLR